jgi:hypothetical protein
MAGRIAGAVLRGIGKGLVAVSVVIAIAAGVRFALSDYVKRP